MPSNLTTDWLCVVEADIAAFEARMREVVPFFRVGDHVEVFGEFFQVSRVERDGMAGYWLKKDRGNPLFWPIDQEVLLLPVVH